MKRNMLRKITSICLYIFLYLFNVFPLFILTGCNQLYDLTDAYIPLESSTFNSMQELVNYSIKLGYVPSYSTNGGEYGLISMGDQTGCVVMRSGKVKCWGSNGNGQLGIGDIVNRETPTLSSALSLSDVTTGNDFSVSISAAALHSCGYFKTGFKCWGDQTNGKLGNGLTTAANVLSPVLVSTLGGKAVKKFNVGDFHSCALFTDGVLKCWGANTNGQLGDGTNTTNVNGVTPNAGGAVTEFSCADNSSCAINSNKELRCWGVITSTSSPSLIASNAVFIGSSDSDAGNPDFFCYINTNQNALCFGVNAFGQLGNGSTSNSSTPVSVSNITGVSMVVEGEKHACAVVNNNKDVYCWGQGTSGQLGNGGTSNFSVPQKVNGLPSGQTIVDIASADRVSCVLLSGEDVYCWGNNSGIDYLGVLRSSMTSSSSAIKILNRADP